MASPKEKRTIDTFLRQLARWRGVMVSGVLTPDEEPGGDGGLDRRFQLGAAWYGLEHTTVHRSVDERRNVEGLRRFLEPLAARIRREVDTTTWGVGLYTVSGPDGFGLPEAQRAQAQAEFVSEIARLGGGLVVGERVALRVPSSPRALWIARDDDIPPTTIDVARFLANPSGGESEFRRLIPRKCAKLVRSPDDGILLIEAGAWTMGRLASLARADIDPDVPAVFLVHPMATLQQAFCLRWAGNAIEGEFGEKLPSLAYDEPSATG